MKKFSALVLSASLLVPYAVLNTPVYAAEQQTQQVTLTYQQAVEQALSKSYTLKNAQEDITRAEEVRQKAAENVKYIPTGQGSSETTNKAFTGYTSAEIGLNMSIKQLPVEKDKVAYSVRKAYNGVLQSLEKKNLASLSLAHDDMLRNIAYAKYRAGLVSSVENTKIARTYEADKNNLDAAQKGLDAAYQTLNQLVGLNQESRPQLVEQLKYEKMPEIDVEAQVSRVISENPDLWKASKAIELKKLELDLYTFNSPANEPYKAKEIDVTKSENNYENLKEQTEKGLRDLYQGIRKAEDNYAALQENLIVAEDGLRAVKVQFDAGLATKADLSERQLAVAQLKEQLVELTISHDNAIQAFYKPWASSGSAQ